MSREKQRFYYDQEFLSSADSRALRILSEYFGPRQRFNRNHVEDTIVFFGSARIQNPVDAQKALDEAPDTLSAEERKILEHNLEMSRYYTEAHDLAYQLTSWSKKLKNSHHRYIVTSGGGPGIMEAANRGASDAKGLAIGLNITLPFEQSGNQWTTPDLDMQFHYFFMRKFWMAYLAKALIAFPGGLGTLDELLEILTLTQTGKIKKTIPIVLFGKEFWSSVINWEYLVQAGTIKAKDLNLFKIVDTIQEAFDFITTELSTHDFTGPNF
ncbi:MAG: TIGR00730 family Rossman fold protein [FCB group bacterium]|nr:TIGR00730 family Rossman fold protein [FCB group bacterium]